VPPLQSGDVRLRPFRLDDAAAIAMACDDPAIGRFTFMEEGLTQAEARQWIEDKCGQWDEGIARFAIVHGTSDELLGHVGLAVVDRHQSAEVFYWVTRSARGRGVAVTAVGLLCDWGFENGIERLYLLIHPENDASRRVAARTGFAYEGLLRSYEPFKGGRADLESWSLLPNDTRT
jgi:RimJ/RimL family protein N-acetyltransferase